MGIHIVHAGESPVSAAGSCGVSVEELVRLNQLGDRSRLTAGLALVIPEKKSRSRRSIEVFAGAYPSAPGSVLGEMGGYFSYLSPISCRFRLTGELICPPDGAISQWASSQYAAPMITLSNLGDNGGFSASLAHRLLRDESLQDNLLDELLTLLENSEYRGVNFNLEYLHTFDRDHYSRFIYKAAALLHEYGYYVFTTLAPRDGAHRTQLLSEAHDYAAHGEYADRVIAAVFDWGGIGGAPQPVSPLDRMRPALEYALEHVPASKLLMGFSNYACSWRLPWAQGDRASIMSDAAAANTAVSSGAEVCFDSAAQASFFRYTDAAGHRHEVWFSDARSILSRLELVNEYSLAGIALWTADQLSRPLLYYLRSMFDAVKIV